MGDRRDREEEEGGISVIAIALKHMLAAGIPHDQIIEAVTEMESAFLRNSAAEAYAYHDKFSDNGHFGSRSNDWRGHRLVIDEMNRRAEETR